MKPKFMSFDLKKKEEEEELNLIYVFLVESFGQLQSRGKAWRNSRHCGSFRKWLVGKKTN